MHFKEHSLQLLKKIVIFYENAYFYHDRIKKIWFNIYVANLLAKIKIKEIFKDG